VRVVGLSAAFALTGTFSDAITVTFGPINDPNQKPTMTGPPPGSTLQRGAPATFTWTGLSGVIEYFFEFTGVNLPFANPNAGSTDAVNGFGGAGGGVVIPATSFVVTIPPSVPAGAYQVRVIGRLASGQFIGRFSDALTVNVQ
jgi:hypothetical protein